MKENSMNYMGDSTWWKERFKSRKLDIMIHEKSLEEDMPYFPSQGKILDVACGDGRNSIYLARLGYEVFAVDFCEEAISRLTYFANRENLTIRTRILDLSQDSLKTLEDKFDVIIMNHYKPISRRLEDFENLLNKNGLLWVNGFRTVPFDNPDVKENDIMQDEDFELLNKDMLVDKKIYESNQREFIRYIWRIQ
jgi:2-polyprenyl-3-methyl-5-hydroxy-6-metoxy-1,4-benzoquinol methylase